MSTLKAQNDSLEVERLHELGQKEAYTNPKNSRLNFEKAVNIINDSILTKDANNNYFLLKKTAMLDRLSYYYRIETDYVSSLKAVQESIDIKETIGETNTLSKSYRLYGTVHKFYNKDSVKIFQSFKKAFELAKSEQNNKEIVSMLNAYSNYYSSNNRENETSRGYALQAYNLADSIGFQRGKSFALRELARYENEKEDYKEAITYSNEALEISTALNDLIAQEKAFKLLGYSYRKSKQLDKAIYYYKKSVEMITEMGMDRFLANRYLSVSNAYYDLKEFEDAFYYYRLYKRQQIKNMNVKSIQDFAELDAKYKYEKQKTIDSIQSVERQKISEAHLIQEASIRFWKYVALITGIFGILFTFIIIMLRRKREQVKLAKIKNQMLQKDIKYKQKDISDFALNISRNQKWREKLIVHIKKLKKSNALKSDTDFKALEKTVLDRDIIDNSAIDFQNKVDILNTAFYEKLQNEFPNLTKTEIKLCSLIRLNIDNNEIAILQNVAVESVYTSRFRLRKKLNLTSDDDLNVFLNKY